MDYARLSPNLIAAVEKICGVRPDFGLLELVSTEAGPERPGSSPSSTSIPAPTCRLRVPRSRGQRRGAEIRTGIIVLDGLDGLSHGPDLRASSGLSRRGVVFEQTPFQPVVPRQQALQAGDVHR